MVAGKAPGKAPGKTGPAKKATTKKMTEKTAGLQKAASRKATPKQATLKQATLKQATLKKGAARAVVAAPADLPGVFRELRAILAPYESKCRVQLDGSHGCTLNTTKDFKGRPMFFAGVALMKNYVSFHLMPVYVRPELLAGVSPGLRRRMQGKSCFNFAGIDPALVRELKRLTAAGWKAFREGGYA